MDQNQNKNMTITVLKNVKIHVSLALRWELLSLNDRGKLFIYIKNSFEPRIETKGTQQFTFPAWNKY